MNGIEFGLNQPFVLKAQQGQVVDVGTLRGLGHRVRVDIGVVGGDDGLRLGELQEGVAVPDLQTGKVEGIVAYLNALAAQIGRNGVAIAGEGDGSRLGDLAVGAVEEGLAKVLGVDGAGGGGGILTGPFQGSLSGFRVDLSQATGP